MPHSAVYDILYKGEDIILTPLEHKTKQVLIFLHGWGQSASFWVDYFLKGDTVPEGTKVILLTAPTRHNEFYDIDAPSWCDFKTLNYYQEDPKSIIKLDQAMESVKNVAEVLDVEVHKLGDSTKCFLAGFSQGGFIASMVWKMYKKTLGGFILYSSLSGKTVSVCQEQEKTPVLWTHGCDDAMAPYKKIIKENQHLDNGKRKLVHLTREGLGHAVDKVIQIETRTFMENILLQSKL